VKIVIDDPDQSKFPIGAHGSAAIYTGGERGARAVLRKISIRGHSWFNWLYALMFEHRSRRACAAWPGFALPVRP